MIGHDNITRAGSGKPSMAGTGLATTRNCMPCGRNLLQTVGGGIFTYRGVRNVWHCAGCKDKREARQAAKEAA